MHELICTEVWGGNGNVSTDLVIPGLNGFLYSRSSEGHKGGDVYYATACSGGLVSRLYLADVTGHGEPVVRVSGWLHEILRDTLPYYEPTRVFDALNHRVHEFGLEAMTTAASITFNAVNRNLAVCYAGHPPALVRAPGEGRWKPLELKTSSAPHGEAENLPFGVSEQTAYHFSEFPLEDGTRIFIYSDGLTETPNASGQLFGVDRLIDVLSAGADKPVSAAAQDVAAAIAHHAGTGDPAHDDITFALLEVTPKRAAPVIVQVVGNKIRNLLKRTENEPVGAV
jgi:sigma-B regulation protein RsbU (phosphoserine phosphatase)